MGRIKQLPQAIEAEEMVLGALLIGVDVDTSKISGQDFISKQHEKIFEAVQNLRHSGQPVSIVTVKGKLSEAGHLENAGGMTKLLALNDTVDSTAHLNHYVKMISEKSFLRQVVMKSGEMLNRIYDGENAMEFMADVANSIIERQMMLSDSDKGFVHVSDICHDAVDDLKRLEQGQSLYTPLDLGVDSVDEKLFIENTDLVIIAARPSVGKTSLAMQNALNKARKGKRVAFVSCETGRKSLLFDRLLPQMTGIPSWVIKTGQEYNIGKVMGALNDLSKLEIYIDDKAGLTPNRILARVKGSKKKFDMIAVDYLQLLSCDNKRANDQNHATATNTRNLKAMAKDLQTPVFVLSQLSRACEARTLNGKRGYPQLADLRDSGAIEQDADSVLFIYRGERYGYQDEEGKADIIIAKQRNGPAGQVKVGFDKQQTRFFDLDENWVN